MRAIMSIFDELKYDANGLIPAVVQEHGTGRVLMVAWMNKESLQRTLEIGETVFWSRSRKEFWHKGATSGHTQKVKRHRVRLRQGCAADPG